MNITQVKVKKVEEGGAPRLKAYAEITIDNCFVVHDIKVIQGDSGLFLAMPSRREKDGQFRDIAHPINRETRELIQKSVLDEYNKEEN